MHELSLCRAIADTALANADGRDVLRIRLRIGHFRQVVPETLDSCWRMLRPDGPLARCELDIEDVPAMIECRLCGSTTTLDQPLLRCRACNSTEVILLTGDEFLVVSIDVAPEQASEEVH
ncbi:MAG: hydrogenase maturation nickel metallochaperone HypA [Actinomycetota bacterium]